MKLLTIKEAAIELRTSEARVRNFIKTDKDFPCVSYSEKSYRIDAAKLHKWFVKRGEKAKEGNA
jgi:hypothetical protein